MKIAILTVFCVLIVVAVPYVSSAGDSDIRVGPYVITYVQAFVSSDHGITVWFNVRPDPGSEVPCLSEAGGVYMPVYVAMRVGGMLKSSSIDTFFSNEERCIKPYMLLNFTDKEYAEIAGRELEVTFITPERPYRGQNWNGSGKIFFSPPKKMKRGSQRLLLFCYYSKLLLN